MRTQVLLGFVALNLGWSTQPVLSKLVLADFGPLWGAWLRYASALAAYAVAAAALGRLPAVRRRLGPPFATPTSVTRWLALGAVGFLTFCLSPLLQMTGLHASRATDNALIVAMEPMVTVLLARIFLAERLSAAALASYGVALLGFALLTGLSPGDLAGSSSPRSVGNTLMLLSLIGEASYSILGRKLMAHHAAAGVFGSALALGLVFLSAAALGIHWHGAGTAVHGLTWKSALALLWLGPLGTAAGYLYWMLALRDTSVASISLTLYLQPVFGALWGYLFMSDRLTGPQALGGAAILAAVFARSAPVFFPSARPKGAS